jgi:hypothetical protein
LLLARETVTEALAESPLVTATIPAPAPLGSLALTGTVRLSFPDGPVGSLEEGRRHCGPCWPAAAGRYGPSSSVLGGLLGQDDDADGPPVAGQPASVREQQTRP